VPSVTAHDIKENDNVTTAKIVVSFFIVLVFSVIVLVKIVFRVVFSRLLGFSFSFGVLVWVFVFRVLFWLILFCVFQLPQQTILQLQIPYLLAPLETPFA
jgi:hypothetical protein